MDLYNSDSMQGAMPVIADTEAAGETKAQDVWIDTWVKKVNDLKGKQQAAVSVKVKPILTALGVSVNVVDALDFSNSSDIQVSPEKEVDLFVIPNVEYKADPLEYQNELLNKNKILNAALGKLKKDYLEETSKRKIMENSVAQITSSIVVGLERVEEVH